MKTDWRLRIPKASRQKEIIEAITEDDDFRFDKIRLADKKARYELAAPTKDDPDNTEIRKTYVGTILLVKKNYYQSDEDKARGIEPKEKRALYILRAKSEENDVRGELYPEVQYISPTALRDWRPFLGGLDKQGLKYYNVLVEFGAYMHEGKRNGFSWPKPTFKLLRELTDEEQELVNTYRVAVNERVKSFGEDAELARLEEAALHEDDLEEADPDDEAARLKRNRKARAADDDEEEKPAKKSKKAKASDDEDEDEKPAKKSKKAKASEDDDEDEDEKPVKKSKKSKAADDDDEDEDEKPAKKTRKAKASEDDEDEDEKPAKKSKKAEEKGTSKGRGKYATLDDEDEDEDEKPAKKSKKKAADDEDDDDEDLSEIASRHKGKGKTPDDEDEEEKPAKKSKKKAADDEDDDED